MIALDVGNSKLHNSSLHIEGNGSQWTCNVHLAWCYMHSSIPHIHHLGESSSLPLNVEWTISGIRTTSIVISKGT